MEIYRHGDLLLKPIKELPKNLQRKKDTIIAYGEATGHNHMLMPTMEEFKDKLQVYLDSFTQKVYFEAEKEVDLKHQEHKTINIAPGIYEVNIEREFDYFTRSTNQVID